MKNILSHDQLGTALLGTVLYAVGLQLPFFSYDVMADERRLSVGDFKNMVAVVGTGENTMLVLLAALAAAAIALASHPEVRRVARAAVVLLSVLALGLLVEPVMLARSDEFRYSGDGYAVPPGSGFYVLILAVLLIAVSPFVRPAPSIEGRGGKTTGDRAAAPR